MPRLRRRAKLRRSSLTEEQWIELTDAPDWPFDDFASRFESPLAKRGAWMEHREAIVATRSLTEDAERGRFSAWWQFEAPKEPRKVVARRGPAPDYALRAPDAKGDPVYESDLAYLARHALATPVELARLAELREEDTARPEQARAHPDSLGPTTLRARDWEAA